LLICPEVTVLRMLRLLVVAALALAVSADHHCGTMDKIKVKAQWAQVFATGLSRQAFGQAVFRSFFAMAPESRGLFDRVHGDNTLSPEFEAHAMRVLGGLDMTISLLDDSDVLHAELDHLKAQHEARDIPGHYFKYLGEALIQVAHAAVGNCFAHDAWANCYNAGIAAGVQ